MRRHNKPIRYIKKGYNVLKDDGVVVLGIKSLQKIQNKQNIKILPPENKIGFVSLVDRESVMRADWSRPFQNPTTKATVTKTINWIMSPPGGGGGHQNIFRFIEYLDKAGYTNNVYVYSNVDNMTISQARNNVKEYCRAKKLTISRYTGNTAAADILFATGWETAYPVFNDSSDAKKMYFVQDFEPYFYPMGTNYILAENTYKFGFHGITAGGWLYNKLSKDYGMKCDYYEFGADPNNYKLTNKGKRKEIFFYARPVTERRGFDLGIMTLELFHHKYPDCIINLAGWDVSMYDVPFPYVNHGAMAISDLHKLYNKCSAALVISLTNMSLLPLELLACGTIPVVNSGDNNSMVSSNPYIKYTDASPVSLSNALGEVVDNDKLTDYAQKAAKSVKNASWDTSADKFIRVIEEVSNNG